MAAENRSHGGILASGRRGRGRDHGCLREHRCEAVRTISLILKHVLSLTLAAPPLDMPRGSSQYIGAALTLPRVNASRRYSMHSMDHWGP